jgi:hypothetical protein
MSSLLPVVEASVVVARLGAVASGDANRMATASIVTLEEFPEMLPRLLIGLFAATSILLSGCAGTPLKADVTARELDSKSVVILSVSHDASVGAGAEAIVYLDNEGSERAVLASMDTVILMPPESDFSSRRGLLYVLELSPGRHSIDAWQVYSAGVRMSSEAPKLEFDLPPGQVIYLGNLHAELLPGHRMLFGWRAAADARMVVRDASQEDIVLAEQRVPALAGRVRAALLTQGLWSEESAGYRRMDPIILPPVGR